jgi:hypothetical protein
VLAACVISGVMVFFLWSGRMALRAPKEQQREAGEHA